MCGFSIVAGPQGWQWLYLPILVSFFFFSFSAIEILCIIYLVLIMPLGDPNFYPPSLFKIQVFPVWSHGFKPLSPTGEFSHLNSQPGTTISILQSNFILSTVARPLFILWKLSPQTRLPHLSINWCLFVSFLWLVSSLSINPFKQNAGGSPDLLNKDGSVLQCRLDVNALKSIEQRLAVNNYWISKTQMKQ